MFSNTVRRAFSPTVVVHVVAFGLLTLWSWRKWPDPIVDFGRELYVPWRITEGDVLYRDVASLYGPFSAYLNAFWFKLFGVSLTTLVICNLAILTAMIAGIHRLLVLSTDRTTATVATLSVLLLCGFSQYWPIGNYNFVTPYAHETTHSLALAVLCMLLAHRGVRDSRLWPVACAGLTFGLVLLTKPETTVALAVAIATLGIAAYVIDPSRRPVLLGGLRIFFVAAVIPGVAFVLYFWRHLPLGVAIQSVASSWSTLFVRGIADNAFYTAGMGVEAPLTSLGRMGGAFLGCVLVGAIAVAVDRRLALQFWLQPGLALRAARIGLLLVGFYLVPWDEVTKVLLLTTVALLVGLFVGWSGRRDDPEGREALLPMLMWAVFALVLLAKMGLNTRLHHYGFYLALPSLTVLVVLVLWLIPQALARSRCHGFAFRQIAFLLLLSGAALHIALSHGLYRMKTLPIGVGRDSFLAFDSPELWQGAAVRDAIAFLDRETPPDSTVVVLPEGVMINYLARRANPTPFISYMPPEMLKFGEDRMNSALAKAPPDFVMLVHKDMSEYGTPPFGASPAYGQRIVAWISQHYEPMQAIGEGRVHERRHSIEILRWRGAPPATTQVD